MQYRYRYTEPLKLKRYKDKTVKNMFKSQVSLKGLPLIGPVKKVLIPKYGGQSFFGNNY